MYLKGTGQQVRQVLNRVKAKFHYASWLEAGSELVRSWLVRAEIWPIIYSLLATN